MRKCRPKAAPGDLMPCERFANYIQQPDSEAYSRLEASLP